jgi:hypothetical protein
MELLSSFETSFGRRNPTGPSIVDGEPYPPDTRDEIRFTIAMNHAVFGHVTEAKEFLQLILEDPTIPESGWLEPAQLFLDNYDEEGDVYRACRVTGNCDTYLSLKRAVSTLLKSDYENIIGRLSDLGAIIHNSGTFDFDQDGTAETWAVLSGLPGDPLELWLFAETAEGIAAEFIADTTTLSPTFNHFILTGDEQFRSEPLYDYIPFTTGTAEIYSFVRHPTTGEPFVIHLAIDSPLFPPEPPDPLVVEFESAVSDLFAGSDPAEVEERISVVINNPAFTPTNEHFYYLGLAYELAGDEPNAVAAYLLAWQDCCDEFLGRPDLTTPNPYAIMAQAKIESVE